MDGTPTTKNRPVVLKVKCWACLIALTISWSVTGGAQDKGEKKIDTPRASDSSRRDSSRSNSMTGGVPAAAPVKPDANSSPACDQGSVVSEFGCSEARTDVLPGVPQQTSAFSLLRDRRSGLVRSNGNDSLLKDPGPPPRRRWGTLASPQESDSVDLRALSMQAVDPASSLATFTFESVITPSPLGLKGL